MRTASRLTALGIAVIGLVFWLFGGPNLGWTKNQVPVTKKDPVTDQEYVEWQANFVPGVDFVGGCILLAGLVFAGSLLGGSRRGGPGSPTTKSAIQSDSQHRTELN